MKITLDTPILDFNGHPVKDEVDKDGFSIRSVLVRSAMYIEPGQNPAGDAKFKQYQLAAKIAAVPPGGSANFSTEELAALRANAGKMWLPLVVGRVWTILDAHESESPTA